MKTLLTIIISCFLISLIALLIILIIIKVKKNTKQISIYLVALSAGTFLGGAFLHLLPEAAEKLELDLIYPVLLIAFSCYYILEKLIHWRHCHKKACAVHAFGYMNLIGDSVHNFIDGLIIASAFLTDVKLGIATLIAVALHEIPQEIGDFGVLIQAGFKTKKALLVNYLVAITVIFGGVVGFLLINQLTAIKPYLLVIAAGGFMYIAMSDLIPEIRQKQKLKQSTLIFSYFVAGMGLMYLVKIIHLH
ncbi:MAG: ZIP family metal transporter [Candidatus Moranbacteria bacterium]|nr:ZIP family metal transporter [Candidatus Moranbacteria bacterium]